MEILIGCILSFLCGVAVTLTAQVLGTNDKKPMPPQRETERKPEYNRHDERIREQWENFLNYNGKEQNGGDN